MLILSTAITAFRVRTLFLSMLSRLWRFWNVRFACACVPAQARLPGPAAMVVGEDDFPDVVLEVDHTTDVHRGKLAYTNRGDSRKCGWRCRTRRRRAVRTGDPRG